MNQTDAKYKVYMHQDVFLINPIILTECIGIFEKQPDVGLIGLFGMRDFPSDRRFYKAWDCGNVIGCNEKYAFQNKLDIEDAQVCAVDGMFMMTQYDLFWREDVLEGWDFYDFSQSIEFAKQGYKILVPAQKEPWSIHDCGYLNVMRYDENQTRFLNVYQKCFQDKYKEMPEIFPAAYRERLLLMQEIKVCWKQLLALKQVEQVEESLQMLEDERFFDTEIAMIRNILGNHTTNES